MADIKGRVKRAQRDAHAEGVVIDLRDGSRQVFTDMDVRKEQFLTKCDLYKGEARDSAVLEVVRAATPESRAAFEAEYGTIVPEVLVVAGGYDGAWVEIYKLEEDGTVTKVRHEGGTPEAERLREEAQQSPPAF